MGGLQNIKLGLRCSLVLKFLHTMQETLASIPRVTKLEKKKIKPILNYLPWGKKINKQKKPSNIANSLYTIITRCGGAHL